LNIDTVVNGPHVRITRLELGAWATNSYILSTPESNETVLIDVPPGAMTLVKHLKTTTLKCILLTHSHIDHYAGLKALRQRIPAPVGVHVADSREWLPFPPEFLLKDGDVVRLGSSKIKAIYTPGHTPGSMCFFVDRYLLSGDTIFPGGPGRTVSPADFGLILKSLETKIFSLPDEVRIFPGHGPDTDLQKEKRDFTSFSSRQHDPKLHGDVVWLTS
jgi:hydroxyacylglutathione hydrolase